MEKPGKLFISHASLDEPYVRAFVELLEGMKMPEDSILCSSVEPYTIPLDEDIYEWIRDNFLRFDLHVVFMLSGHFYNSCACLNEMGAMWLARSRYTNILLPGFGFEEIRGCISPNRIGIKLDNKDVKPRLNSWKNKLVQEFHLEMPNENKWERIRDEFIETIQRIRQEELHGQEQNPGAVSVPEAGRISEESASVREAGRIQRKFALVEEDDRNQKEPALVEEVGRNQKESVLVQETGRKQKESASVQKAGRIQKESASVQETDSIHQETQAKEGSPKDDQSEEKGSAEGIEKESREAGIPSGSLSEPEQKMIEAINRCNQSVEDLYLQVNSHSNLNYNSAAGRLKVSLRDVQKQLEKENARLNQKAAGLFEKYIQLIRHYLSLAEDCRKSLIIDSRGVITGASDDEHAKKFMELRDIRNDIKNGGKGSDTYIVRALNGGS